jgi:hypothetical protein
MWTVIMHFGRGHSETFTYKTAEEAQEAVRISVFANRDCINCSIFKTN